MMDVAIIDIKHYAGQNVTNRVTTSLMYFIMLLKKGNVLNEVISYFRIRLFKRLYSQWDSIILTLESGMAKVELLPLDEAVKLKKVITKAIDHTIDLNESVVKANFNSDPEYTKRYKLVLKSLNKTNNLLHTKITKDVPIQKTSESLRMTLSSINNDLLANKLPA